MQYHGPIAQKIYEHRLFTHKIHNVLPDATLANSTHSGPLGNTSRTDNFRNARCRQEIESTTKRANSRTNNSSVRQLITNVARSIAVALRLLRTCEKRGPSLRPGYDFLKWVLVSRNRFLGVRHNGHSKRQCHSVSLHCWLPALWQNRHARFRADSRSPGNAGQRDS